jgi:hypothetical protein
MNLEQDIPNEAFACPSGRAALHPDHANGLIFLHDSWAFAENYAAKQNAV